MSILVINPNSTSQMTDSVRASVSQFSSAPATYFTSPSGPPSINSDSDCHASAESVLAALTGPNRSPSLTPPDVVGVLIACYSVHPLVAQLAKLTTAPVVGIFEASVAAALRCLAPGQKFGIVSTGAVWEAILAAGVRALLGEAKAADTFAGVQTTGLSATELHDTSPEEVKRRMVDATKRLVEGGDVGAVCLGCAGMVGMDDWVREACVEALGEEKGRKVVIIDGVKAGFSQLEESARGCAAQ